MKTKHPSKAALSASLLLIIHAPCFGFSGFLTTWRSTYPNSTSSDVVGCANCHASTGGGNPWNAYGWSIRQAYYAAGRSDITAAIRSVEGADADGDGSANLIEIKANTLPGWTVGNNNSYFFKNNTVTSGNPPVVTSNVDPRKAVAWILSQGLSGNDALETSDPDKDGATNLEEYLFGGLPNNSGSSPRPLVLSNGGNNPSFAVDVRVDDPEFIITPKWSNNLADYANNGFLPPVDQSSIFGGSYVRRQWPTSLGPVRLVFFRVEGTARAP